MKTTTRLDRTSIKSVVATCEEFEQDLGFSVISHDAEARIRREFEAEARKALDGIETSSYEITKALAVCDTVAEMKAALLAAIPGTSTEQRTLELLTTARVDTEKLLGHFSYADLVKSLGADKANGWETAISKAMEKKGVCLATPPADGEAFGYRQREALHGLGQLLTYGSEWEEHYAAEVREGLWEILVNGGLAGFDKMFATKTTVYKNGNIVVKGFGPTNATGFISQVLAAKLRAWARHE